MTMIELVWLMLVVLASVVVGKVVGETLHWTWGCVAGVLAFLVIPRVLGMITERPFGKGRGSPPCQSGDCPQGSIKCTGSVGHDPVYQCTCGRRYIYDGVRFSLLEEAGARRPYKRWKSRQGWIDDTE